MVHNPEKLELATYYRKRGFSYSEIANICGVSKGTISNWFSKKRFSKQVAKENAHKAATENRQRIALLNKAKVSERAKRYSEAERSAMTEFRHFKQDPKFMAGVTLYMSLGNLTHSSAIRFTSNDPILHQAFIRFMRNYLGVPKAGLKIWLFCYKDQKEAVEITQWSKIIGLSPAQFGKTQFHEKPRSSALQSASGSTIIGSTVVKRKLLRWVELTKKSLKVEYLRP